MRKKIILPDPKILTKHYKPSAFHFRLMRTESTKTIWLNWNCLNQNKFIQVSKFRNYWTDTHHDFKLQRKKVWVRFCINIGKDYHWDYRNTGEVNSYHTAQNLTLKYILFSPVHFLVPAIICYCLWFWMIKNGQKAIKHIEFYAPVRIVISAFAHLIFVFSFFILLLEFVPLLFYSNPRSIVGVIIF